MKYLKITLLSLALPTTLFASDRLIYPDAKIKLSRVSGKSLKVISDQLELGLDPSNFKLKEVKHSLMAGHYYFQQYKEDREIEGAQVVVSVKTNGELIKLYNTAVADSMKLADASIPYLSEKMAFAIAWKHLNVTGELLDHPTAKLVYSKNFELVYKINLSTSMPFGHYEIEVNAHTGEVLSQKDAFLPRMKWAQSARPLVKTKSLYGSFSSALKAYEQKSQKNFFEVEGLVANGTAQIFDPNPVVNLGRTDLTDDTDGREFLGAYRSAVLHEITFIDGVYFLKGPKVNVIDFERPNVAPSTSVDGMWIYERKNTSFNDAMTYLHLDRSIRYIESLGYHKNRAIFTKPLEVDANGVNGADNSYYIPSSRRLSFGHGCVDDNEDTDVILHELGHAIHHHINPSWYGGDTGAMGEGFGDYWAASYSVTTENGLSGNINWVFKWDGHNECWPGRNLDAYSMIYNPRKTYPAHARMDGGISDELWSTPIFQAFLELYRKGVSRSDIDKIILEAHFGLGSGVRMPEMAKAIVRTAKLLFPNKDYDQVYLKHFAKQKIL